MTFDNPYEPSELPADVQFTQWPEGGLYRDGAYWVVHHEAGLPMTCLKTGEEADDAQGAELVCSQGDDGSIDPARRSFWLGSRYKLEIPVSHAWLARQKFALRVALALIGVGVLTLIAAIGIGFIPSGPIRISVSKYEMIPTAVMVGSCGLLILAVGVVIHDMWRPVVRLDYIAGGYYWLSGAKEIYLDSLPQWPVPKPSFWQQVFSLRPIGPVPPAALPKRS